MPRVAALCHRMASDHPWSPVSNIAISLRLKVLTQGRRTGSEWDKYDSYLYSRSDTAQVVLGTLRTYQKSSVYLEGNT